MKGIWGLLHENEKDNSWWACGFHCPPPPLWIEPLERMKQCNDKAVPSDTIVQSDCQHSVRILKLILTTVGDKQLVILKLILKCHTALQKQSVDGGDGAVVIANKSSFLHRLSSFFVFRSNIFCGKFSATRLCIFAKMCWWLDKHENIFERHRLSFDECRSIACFVPYHIIPHAFDKGKLAMKGHRRSSTKLVYIMALSGPYMHRENTPHTATPLSVCKTDTCQGAWRSHAHCRPKSWEWFLQTPCCTSLLYWAVVCGTPGSWNTSGLSPLTWHIDKVLWLVELLWTGSFSVLYKNCLRAGIYGLMEPLRPATKKIKQCNIQSYLSCTF